jgi:hypothetical protein
MENIFGFPPSGSDCLSDIWLIFIGLQIKELVRVGVSNLLYFSEQRPSPTQCLSSDSQTVFFCALFPLDQSEGLTVFGSYSIPVMLSGSQQEVVLKSFQSGLCWILIPSVLTFTDQDLFNIRR